MARPKLINGDCSALPFSRARSSTLRTSRLTTESLAEPISDQEFQLRGYVGTVILQPVELPLYDPRGVRSVTNKYEYWKDAIDGRGGVSGWMFSRKANGIVPFHSFIEQRIHTSLELNPLVVEIRAQYPEFDQEKWALAKHKAELMRRIIPDFHGKVPAQLVITVDCVATLALPGKPELLYHTISGKPAALLQLPKVIRRHEKEKALRARWNSTFEIMTDMTFSEQEHRNNVRILRWLSKIRDVHEHTHTAAEFAARLKKTKAKDSVNQVLARIGNRMNLTRSECYRYFAVAHYCGYLRWDHKFPLRPNTEFRLAIPPYRY